MSSGVGGGLGRVDRDSTQQGTPRPHTLSVVLAGGGTAGHVEPAMAVADALTALHPGIRITALGTERGLETSLVPDRGYQLELVTPVPLPRKLSGDLLRLPWRVRRSIRETAAVLAHVGADVVVGFGGYVAVPAYLAARRRGVPVVVHEANARAGLANRLGARTARRVLAAVPRARPRSIARCRLQPPSWPPPVSRCCMRMVRRTPWNCLPQARATRRMLRCPT